MNNTTYQTYEPPSRDIAISMLAKFSSQDQATNQWDTYCEECNIPANTSDLTELERVFDHMLEKPGTQKLVGRSLIVKIHTYKILNRKK